MNNLEGRFKNFISSNYQNDTTGMVCRTYRLEDYDCSAEKDVVVYIIGVHMWYDGSGGIERKCIVGIYKNDEDWQQFIELGPYAHRTDARCDNYSNCIEKVKVLEVSEVEVLVEINRRKSKKDSTTFKDTLTFKSKGGG